MGQFWWFTKLCGWGRLLENWTRAGLCFLQTEVCFYLDSKQGSED